MVILYESVDIDFADPDVIHVRYMRVEDGHDHRDELVLDRANAPWLAAELDATAADQHRANAVLDQGSDLLKVFSGGHEADPYVNVTNDRKAAASWARMWALMLRAPYARQLATLLRERKPPHPLARQIRRWAEKLCNAPSTSKEDLAATLEGAFEDPPVGVKRFTLDDREVGLGGVAVDIDDGVLARWDIEEVFGRGMPLRRLDPRHMLHRQHEVTLPDEPYTCTLFVRYGVDEADDRVRQVKLRVDNTRAAPRTD